MLVFVAAGLADPPPGTGFMFTLQSLAKMMMMGVMIMRDDVCGLFSTNIPMIPPYSIWQNFEAIWPKYELLRLEDKFNNKKFCCKIPEKIWLNIKHFIKRKIKIKIVCFLSRQSLQYYPQKDEHFHIGYFYLCMSEIGRKNWNLGKSYTVKQYNNDFNPRAVEFDQIIAACMASCCKLKAQVNPYSGVDGRFFSNSAANLYLPYEKMPV